MRRGFAVALAAILALAAAVWIFTLWLERSGPAAGPPAALGFPDAPSRLRERLRTEAELDVEPAALEAVGREAERLVEARLDAVASELDPGSTDWRPVFATLARSHPPTEAAVLDLYRAELASAEAFVRERDLVPLPAGAIEVEPVENPILRRVFPLALYLDPSRLGVVLRPPRAEGPTPAYLANHCGICVPPLAVHEGFPGHHVAFSLEEPGPETDRRDHRRGIANMTFQEGWAQYGELLMLEAGYWEGAPARELGALRLLLLRAVRVEVDGGLAAGRLDDAAAAALYVDRLLMTPGAAAAEVAGHREEPGRKSSYLVGALQILALRAAVIARDDTMPPRELHRRLLLHPAPIPVVARERFGVELPAGLPPITLLPLPSAGAEARP